MAAGPARRDTNRMRNGHIQATQVVDLASSTHKRRRCVENIDSDDDSEGTHEEIKAQPKRAKIQTDSRELKRPKVAKIPPSASRSSPRLLKLREVKAQLREESPRTRSSAPARHRGQRGAQSQKNASTRPQRANRRQDPPNQGNPKSRLSESPKASRDKRQRALHSDDEPNCDARRQRQQSDSEVPIEQVGYIERWLDESCPPRTSSIADEVQFLEATDTMSRKPGAVLPSPDDSFERTTTLSRKSERTTASVHDSDYDQALSHRNIYIDCEDPPADLMRRATSIILRERASPEMDDAIVQNLKERSRRIRKEAEDVIVKQFAPHLIPAMDEVPDRRLEMNSNQLWANSIPIPLKPSLLTNHLPLPKPKPDLAFGYSQAAFTENQLGTIQLLVDDQFDRSYAVPDQKLRFPFLSIEFKSQAKNGTHYIGTNQAAGTGAIAISGNMELMQRSFGMDKFDYEEPQFFSVTMDHELARINVHWLKAPVYRGNHSFQVEGLSQHLLSDAGGIRAVTRAIKNIIDYGADVRLRTLCTALDAYREMVVRDREAANRQRLRHVAVPKVHGEQGRRSDDLALQKTTTKNTRRASVQKDTSVNELVMERITKKRNKRKQTQAEVLE